MYWGRVSSAEPREGGLHAAAQGSLTPHLTYPSITACASSLAMITWTPGTTSARSWSLSMRSHKSRPWTGSASTLRRTVSGSSASKLAFAGVFLDFPSIPGSGVVPASKVRAPHYAAIAAGDLSCDFRSHLGV